MNQTFSISAVALLGIALLTSAVRAQTPTVATSNNGVAATGMREQSMTTSDADQQVLRDAAQGSAYDRATAELAVQKAQNKNVQRYAMRLMDDHNRLNKMLLMQANKRGLILSLEMNSGDQSSLQLLMNQSAGNDFDVAYLQEAIKINTDDILRANAAIEASDDKELRGLMSDYAHTEQKHLDEASKILSQLQKNSPAMNSGMMPDMKRN